MIRRLKPTDKDIYFELAEEFYSSDAVLSPVPKSHFEYTFQELMRSDVYAECFLFECDGVVAGYALLAKTFSQEAGGLTVWIEEIYLREQFRSQGLGSEFFAFLESEIPARRYRLEIEPENERAVALYKKRGFKFLEYGQMVKDC